MTNISENKPLNETEAGILRAAEHEFMTKGFAGARTTTIAEAAGVTHAMFHYYFRTKEKLFDKIISEKFDMLKEVILLSIEDISLPLDEMIQNLINIHLDFISGNSEFPRFLISEIFNNPERMTPFMQSFLKIAPKIIRSLQYKIDKMASAGKYRSIDARSLLLDIISLNIFPYAASPLISNVLGIDIASSTEFLEQRKKENFDTIMRKLKID